MRTARADQQAENDLREEAVVTVARSGPPKRASSLTRKPPSSPWMITASRHRYSRAKREHGGGR